MRRVGMCCAGAVLLVACGDAATSEPKQAEPVDVRGIVAVPFPTGGDSDTSFRQAWCDAYSGLKADTQVLVLDGKDRRLGVGTLGSPVYIHSSSACESRWEVPDLQLDDGVMVYEVVGQAPVYFTRDEALSEPLRLTLTR